MMHVKKKSTAWLFLSHALGRFMRQDHASTSWTLRMRGREVSMATKASTPVPVLGDTERFGEKLPAAVKKSLRRK